jgi:hypothetical protein
LVAVERIDRRYTAIGGAAEFLTCTDREVLCESGAMTGKSHSLLRKADLVARTNPGCRQFFARDTRKSLTESVLVEWEDAILWRGHPAIVGTAQRAQRDHYVYPNGAEIVLFGLDSPGEHMSTQYDRGYVFEAVQVKQEAWEHLLTRMRNGKTDYHQLVADCNPGAKGHWLNRRFPKAGEPNPQIIYADDDEGFPVPVSSRRRILYRHDDNPRLYDPDTGKKTKFGFEYIDGTLGALTGARRARLKDHLWVSEEGQVWPEFDETTHCVYAKDVPELVSYSASMDFGYTAPGVLQIWGYSKDQRSYRVAEVYKRGWSPDQWADAAIALHREFPYDVGVGDSENAGDIAYMNKRLRSERGESFGWIPCDKAKGVMHSVELVRDLLKRKVLFFVKDALRYGPDEDLRARELPVCTEQEIPGYMYKKTEEGKEVRDEPDRGTPNHGCDATRYNAIYKWGRDINPTPKKWDFPKPKAGEWSMAEDFLEVAEKEGW